jgi:hypothetical protein
MAASQMLASTPARRAPAKPALAVPDARTAPPFSIIPSVATLMLGFAVVWTILSVVSTFYPATVSWIERLV